MRTLGAELREEASEGFRGSGWGPGHTCFPSQGRGSLWNEGPGKATPQTLSCQGDQTLTSHGEALWGVGGWGASLPVLSSAELAP